MPRITFTDKVDSRIINVNPINKIVSSDVNELKDGINNNEIDIIANTSAIALNTPKISFDSTSSTRLAGTNGTNTGDQDLSGLQLKSEKDSVSGYAGLDGSGKINPSQLPALAITDTFVVASQSAMLALTAQVGDVAIRTDLSKTFILKTDGSTVLANWQELQTPTDSVTTVFGRSGVVTAQNNDYTFAQINKSTSSLADLTTRNFSDLQNKPTTVSGYGITDSYNETEVNTLDAQNVKLTGNQSIDGIKTFLDPVFLNSYIRATNFIGSNPNTTVRNTSSDGADNGVLTLAGGGFESSSRGAVIKLYGNENSNGNISLSAGGIGIINIDSATTFASSVTANSLIVNGTGGDTILLTKSNNQPALTFQGATSSSIIQAGDDFEIYTNGSLRQKITKAGSVTFASSVTANGRLDLKVTGVNWSETNQGTSKGSIHLDPETTTDNAGNAITFGASDTGNGETAQAGIYVRTDSAFGSKMYFSTTDSYALGSKTALTLNSNQSATFSSTVTANGVLLTSDKRLKENIKDLENNSINVNWKTFELKSEKGQKRYGVIAQELEIKNPEFVRTDDKGMKSVAYIDLLIAKISELEKRLEKAGI